MDRGWGGGRGYGRAGPAVGEWGKSNHFTEIRFGNEEGLYLRLIDSCITKLQARGPSRTFHESEEDEKKKSAVSFKPKTLDLERGTLQREPKACTLNHEPEARSAEKSGRVGDERDTSARRVSDLGVYGLWFIVYI